MTTSTKGAARGRSSAKTKQVKQTSTRIAALREQKEEAAKEVRKAKNGLARPLTEMQKAFIQHWASGETIYSASARAGFKDGGATGYKLARDPAIIDLYNAEKKKYEISVQMTRTRVMEGLLEGIEMAKLVADPNAMIRGWREVGQMCGYYAPKEVKHTVHGQIVHRRIENLDDDTLLKIVKGEITDADLNDVIDVEATEVTE